MPCYETDYYNAYLFTEWENNFKSYYIHYKTASGCRFLPQSFT